VDESQVHVTSSAANHSARLDGGELWQCVPDLRRMFNQFLTLIPSSCERLIGYALDAAAMISDCSYTCCCNVSVWSIKELLSVKAGLVALSSFDASQVDFMISLQTLCT